MGKVTKSYQQVRKHSHSDTPKPCQNRVFGRLYRVIFKYRILRKISSSDFFKFPQSIPLVYMHKKPLRYFYRKGLFVFCPLFSREEEQSIYLINKCIELI